MRTRAALRPRGSVSWSGSLAVAACVRRIRIADLDAAIGHAMPRAAGVDSCVDHTGAPYPCPDCFANALSLENYWQCQGFYGRLDGDIVQTLHVTPLTVPAERRPAVVDAIVSLARRSTCSCSPTPRRPSTSATRRRWRDLSMSGRHVKKHANLTHCASSPRVNPVNDIAERPVIRPVAKLAEKESISVQSSAWPTS